jgi:hypothetical protein
MNNMQPIVNSTNIPPAPELKRASLSSMLAGGIFLFATSVSPGQRKFADQLLTLSQEALRSDPTITMELGMGIESGGVYTSSYISNRDDEDAFQGRTVDRLIVQFQINGGNAWAQGIAYGIRDCLEPEKVRLLTLEVANMDAVLNNQSFKVPLVIVDNT